MYIEGNKGADYIKLTPIQDNLMRLEVGNCCVIVMDHIIPVEWLTSLIARIVIDEGIITALDYSGWSAEYIQKLKAQIKPAEEGNDD